MIAVLYYASPNARLPGFRWITPGAVLAVVALDRRPRWGSRFYVGNFGSYDKTYGTLGGVVTFLVWLWITNVAVLLGAELNAELERGRQLAAGVPEAERELQLPQRDLTAVPPTVTWGAVPVLQRTLSGRWHVRPGARAWPSEPAASAGGERSSVALGGTPPPGDLGLNGRGSRGTVGTVSAGPRWWREAPPRWASAAPRSASRAAAIPRSAPRASSAAGPAARIRRRPRRRAAEEARPAVALADRLARRSARAG